MSKTNFITFELHNLGPFKDKVKLAENEIGPLRTTIYARNGSGKSFIGRAFSQIEHFQQKEPFKYIEELPTFGADNMSFSFSCYHKNEGTICDRNDFSFSYCQGEKEPAFNLNSNWKVHVFNQDFIEQHISQDTHTLNSTIPGDIIIGEENVKINQLEKENQQLMEKANGTVTKLKAVIDSAKEKLNSNKEFFRLPEFKEIDIENVMAEPTVIFSFEKEQENWIKLRDLDEDLPGLQAPEFEFNETLILACANNLLRTVKASNIPSEIKERIDKARSFFEQGTAMWEEEPDKCPFCSQLLQDSFLELVKTYALYFKDEEAKFTKSLEENISHLQSLQKDLQTLELNLKQLSLSYAQQTAYFPGIKEKLLEEFKSFKRLQDSLKELNSFLIEKCSNKDKIDFDCKSLVSIISEDCRALQNYLMNINNKVVNLEGAKSRMSETKKNVRKNLCKALICHLHQQNKSDIILLNAIKQSITQNNSLITELRSKVKLSKNTVIQNLFKNLLKEFFDNYYTYDEELGRLKHNNKIPLNSTRHIISDGEKSVIAFAHYISLIHKVVNNKEDYNNLLLVIDDPISSMDFNFVYQVCHVIKNLTTFIPGITTRRFIILTHNYEFTNILLCNNITSKIFHIENGKIEQLSVEVMLPYDAHLRHLYRILQEREDITFHTPNSIRHVLETINSFKYPNRKLLDGLLTEDSFKEKKIGELYLLIQDLSHGRLRSSELYSKERIKKLTECVMEYIKDNFSGQLQFIETQEKVTAK